METDMPIRYRLIEEENWGLSDNGLPSFCILPDAALQQELMGGTFKDPVLVCPVSHRITEIEVEYDPEEDGFEVLSFSVARAIDDEPIEMPWSGDLETTPITFNEAETAWLRSALPMILKRVEENEARGWPEVPEREDDYLR